MNRLERLAQELEEWLEDRLLTLRWDQMDGIYLADHSSEECLGGDFGYDQEPTS